MRNELFIQDTYFNNDFMQMTDISDLFPQWQEDHEEVCQNLSDFLDIRCRAINNMC